MKYILSAAGLLAGILVIAPAISGDDLEEAALALYAMDRSGVTTTRALDIAEQTVNALAYEYELEEDDGALFHEFKLMDLDGNTRHELRIAVADGSVSQQQESVSCSVICKDDDVKAARALDESGYSLRQALEAAASGERELLEEAEVELEHGVRYFKLEFIGPKGERDVLLDIDSGQVIPSLTSNGR